jgi:hypothetical protein
MLVEALVDSRVASTFRTGSINEPESSQEVT